VGQAAAAAALVATSSSAPRLQACRARTRSAAVALAAIAATAQQHLLTATRANEQAGGMVDQLRAPREDSRGTPMTRRGAVQRRTTATYTATASASRRGVGHGVRISAATRRADAVPAYHSGTARVVPHSSSPALITQARGPVRQAALQGGLPDDFHCNDDQPKNATSPPLIGNGTSPPLDQSAVSPPNKRAS